MAQAGTVAAILGLVMACTAAVGGEWVYPLDDTYIHLELAWRLVQDGTWGINPGAPSSASSSPMWSLLLAAGLLLLGHDAGVALLLASVAALSALWVSDRQLPRELGAAPRVLALLLITALAPLPAMAALGMEHCLQIALVLAVGAAAIQDLEGPEGAAGPGPGALALLAALVFTRFEGLFLGVAWAGLALLARRPGAAVRVGLAGLMPVVAFAAFSLAQGLPALPAGMLMKSVPLDGHPLQNLLGNLTEGGAVLVLPSVLVWVLDAARGGRLGGTVRARLLALTVALHLGLGAVGWYYRYEAWLVAWSTLLGIQAAIDLRRRGAGRRTRAEALLIAVLILAALVPTARRTYEAHVYMPGRTVYIADAKVRLARALEATEPRAVVALHDIGAMAWETDLRIVDTAGLGTVEVLRLSRARRFTGQTIGELTRDLGATIGFGTWAWMESDRPVGWAPVARLTWGLDEVRKNEPLVAYAIAPDSEAVALEWLRRAADQMGGRGQIERFADGQWRPDQ